MLLSNVESVAGDTLMLSFNPCFIGCYSLTVIRVKYPRTFISTSFNPCFIGCYSLTSSLSGNSGGQTEVVSILVLLDVTL